MKKEVNENLEINDFKTFKVKEDKYKGIKNSLKLYIIAILFIMNIIRGISEMSLFIVNNINSNLVIEKLQENKVEDKDLQNTVVDLNNYSIKNTVIQIKDCNFIVNMEDKNISTFEKLDDFVYFITNSPDNSEVIEYLFCENSKIPKDLDININKLLVGNTYIKNGVIEDYKVHDMYKRLTYDSFIYIRYMNKNEADIDLSLISDFENDIKLTINNSYLDFKIDNNNLYIGNGFNFYINTSEKIFKVVDDFNNLVLNIINLEDLRYDFNNQEFMKCNNIRTHKDFDKGTRIVLIEDVCYIEISDKLEKDDVNNILNLIKEGVRKNE